MQMKSLTMKMKQIIQLNEITTLEEIQTFADQSDQDNDEQFSATTTLIVSQRIETRTGRSLQLEMPGMERIAWYLINLITVLPGLAGPTRINSPLTPLDRGPMRFPLPQIRKE